MLQNLSSAAVLIGALMFKVLSESTFTKYGPKFTVLKAKFDIGP